MNVYTVIRPHHPCCNMCGRKMDSWWLGQAEEDMRCDNCWRQSIKKSFAEIIAQSFNLDPKTRENHD